MNKCFITCDIDWAHDDVLAVAISLFEKYDTNVTWFVTHNTPLLHRLRENPRFELGIHPNFNRLLNGDISNGGSVDEILYNILKIVPEATAVRSHSMLQSSPILDRFKGYGITHDANMYIPYSSAIKLLPWIHWNGLTRIPHFWEDDVCWQDGFSVEPGTLLEIDGIKVFDFHPVHIFLNTESHSRYDRARSAYHDPKELTKFINEKYGTRDFLTELLCECTN